MTIQIRWLYMVVVVCVRVHVIFSRGINKLHTEVKMNKLHVSFPN